MTNGKKTAILIIFLTLLISLTACNEHKRQVNKNNVSSAQPLQCLAQQSPCRFDVFGGRVEVLFDSDKIVAEQAINMVVNFHGTATLTNISGYLEGVDMFMGKIPLFLEPSSANEKIAYQKTPISTEQALITPNKVQVFHAELLVGSCSAEKMTWRMWLTFTTSDQQTQTKMLTLVSYRH
ncbi:MAG: hypothetical protein ACPG52_06945 [Cognaticolwellia sp.]